MHQKQKRLYRKNRGDLV